MKVKLISVTKPVEESIKDFTPEELTTYIARVSNKTNQHNTETAPRLLGYCLKHGHFSVFEHVSFTVEILTSRAICAQILRHRSFVFQEYSQRYAEVAENEFYPARRQDTKNRQNSIDDMSEEDKQWFLEAQEDNWEDALWRYKEALRRGVAKEQARMFLPLSTQTTLYMTGNLRSWITYINLRKSNETQKEHRDIALEIQQIFIEQFPNIAKALEWA